MKKIVFVAVCSVFLLVSRAQDCTYYFPSKKGAVIEMKSYNGKDKLTGSSKTEVTEVAAGTVKFNSESLDDKGKTIAKGDYEVTCKDGEVVLDMKQYLKGINLSSYQGMDVKVNAKNMTIPSKLSAGQALNDGSISVKISNPMMTIMNININITNRKVEGFEDVTVPAGTFHCAKITYDIESKIMVVTKNKGVEYISDKVGAVRSESYDTDGKLQAKTIMVSYKE
jgi:hypothetical protein